MQEEILKTDQELVLETFIDTKAFSGIVERYEAPLRRYLRRLGCGDDNDADDVLQEIFIKVFVNLKEYDHDLKFSSWIYRIAHNETISFFRKKNVRPGVLNLSTQDASDFFAQLADDQDFVELAFKRDDARFLHEAISHIHSKYKEILVLRFLEDKSYNEISDILKIPEGTIATLISRGKKELKVVLENKGMQNI